MSTIKDVAKLAKVSITTVSMVLNNTEHKISDETKYKVFEAAEKLNYKPNNIARSLVNGKTNIIMLVIPDISNPFFGLLAKEISIIIEEMGYVLYVYNSNNINLTEEKFQEIIKSNLIAGTLVIDRRVKHFSNNIIKNNIIVFLDEFDYETKKHYVVTGDNELGGYLAIKHLVEKGNEKIGLVIGPRESSSSNRRLSGAIKCAMDYDIYIESSNIVHADYTFEGGLKAGRKFLDKDLDALFCFNDMSSYGVIQSLNENGIDIPKDISIVSYDNLFINNILSTKLTSIDQNLPMIAKQAVIMVDSLLNNKVIQKQIFIKPKLIIRDSVFR